MFCGLVLDTRTEVVIVYVPDVLWVGVRYQDWGSDSFMYLMFCGLCWIPGLRW